MTATAHQEPDHVPLALNEFGYRHLPDAFRGPHAWADYSLSRGCDAWLWVSMPRSPRADVAKRTWEERRPGEEYPIVVAEYVTPRGTLRHAVCKSADWPYAAGELDLFSDFNPPRAVEHPVKTERDLEVLEYLFDVPEGAMLAEVRSHIRRTRQDADERGVIVQGVCTTGGDSMAWLCGFDHMLYFALDEPAFVRRLLDVIHRDEMRRLEMLLDTGAVDIVVRRGYYESLRNVSPAIYREFLAPLIKDEAALTHQAGLPYAYLCTGDIMGLVPIWKEIEVDIAFGADPVQGDADLARLKAEAGDWLSVWGGINTAITLTQGADAEIRAAVETAVRTLGPGGGFLLWPVDSLGPDVPSHALDVLIDAWRACATYPLQPLGG